MSLGLILQRAQTHVQRVQIEAAFKLYKGLLVTFPYHPQVNGEMGMLCLQHRPPKFALTDPMANLIGVALIDSAVLA